LAARIAALAEKQARERSLAAAREALAARAFDAATSAAEACAAPIPDDIDAEWAHLPEVVADCHTVASRAEQGKVEAAARDREFRATLRGDRAAIYATHGAPTEPADVAGAARAAQWVYVIGPSGALGRVERLVLTFRGDKLVGRRRTTRDAR